MSNQPHPKKQFFIIALGVVIALIVSFNALATEQSLFDRFSSGPTEDDRSKQELLTGGSDNLHQIKTTLSSIF